MTPSNHPSVSSGKSVTSAMWAELAQHTSYTESRTHDTSIPTADEGDESSALKSVTEETDSSPSDRTVQGEQRNPSVGSVVHLDEGVLAFNAMELELQAQRHPQEMKRQAKRCLDDKQEAVALRTEQDDMTNRKLAMQNALVAQKLEGTGWVAVQPTQTILDHFRELVHSIMPIAKSTLVLRPPVSSYWPSLKTSVLTKSGKGKNKPKPHTPPLPPFFLPPSPCS
eukprot:Sspe_Gene.28280::Locus_12708_Transcript_1_1_Confidence_1.000_Length_1276::g.28280::m.28280